MFTFFRQGRIEDKKNARYKGKGKAQEDKERQEQIQQRLPTQPAPKSSKFEKKKEIDER